MQLTPAQLDLIAKVLVSTNVDSALRTIAINLLSSNGDTM